MPARRVVVPLVVLALAAALWFWPGFGDEPLADLPGDAVECMANLRQVYAGLLIYSVKNGHSPTGSGAAFLEALFTGNALEDTPAKRAFLLCPGTHTPYAARDAAAHPLARFPSGGAELEALAACNGNARLPHAGCLNVLYSDGSVQALLLEQEIESGRLPPGTTTVPIGPDSPIPDLRKLSTK